MIMVAMIEDEIGEVDLEQTIGGMVMIMVVGVRTTMRGPMVSTHIVNKVGLSLDEVAMVMAFVLVVRIGRD